MPMEFFTTAAPEFTLYGDGTVIFKPVDTRAGDPFGGQGMLPYQVGHLDEDGVQALLRFALGEGRLLNAKANYENNMVADAGTTTLTLNAGGLNKVVNIYALGMEDPNLPQDVADRQGFQALTDQLGTFEQRGQRRRAGRSDRLRPRLLPRLPAGCQRCRSTEPGCRLAVGRPDRHRLQAHCRRHAPAGQPDQGAGVRSSRPCRPVAGRSSTSRDRSPISCTRSASGRSSPTTSRQRASSREPRQSYARLGDLIGAICGHRPAEPSERQASVTLGTVTSLRHLRERRALSKPTAATLG